MAIYAATPARWRPHCLLALSCATYLALTSAWTLLLVGETVLAFGVGSALGRAATDRQRNWWLLVGLVPIAGALVGLKMAGALQGLLLPLGVSYYTFKLIAYVVDVYFDPAVRALRFVDFAAFATFAPQMVSGPIQRPEPFLFQLTKVRSGDIDAERIERAFFEILRGLLLKLVIGDRLGIFIAAVDAEPQNYSRGVLLLTVVSYTLQLYADFAGYTLIAIGVGRLFGIEGPPNFNAPFSASTIQAFWRRWHMSLSSWVADYIFQPLSLCLRHAGRLGLAISLIVSMLVIGIWHAFTWPFVVFGLMHGIFICSSALTLGARDRLLGPIRWLTPLRRAWGIAAVYAMMTVSMIYWRAPTLHDAWIHIQLLLHPSLNTGPQITDIPTDYGGTIPLCMAIAFWHGAGAPGLGWFARRDGWVVPKWVVGGLGLLLLSTLSTESGAAFLYGQF
jgi:alginate O-acetyltransferase complex protein AlgI